MARLGQLGFALHGRGRFQFRFEEVRTAPGDSGQETRPAAARGLRVLRGDSVMVPDQRGQRPPSGSITLIGASRRRSTVTAHGFTRQEARGRAWRRLETGGAS